MARETRQKTVKEIQALPDGMHAIGCPCPGGLRVEKKDGRIERFVYRYRKGPKEQKTTFPATYTIAEARRKAAEIFRLYEAGTSPREQRQKRREEQRRTDAEKERKRQTLNYMAEQYFREALTGTERAKKTKMSAYRVHIAPCIGKKLISETKPQDAYRALAPIWNTKPAIAKAAYMVSKAVFRWAIVVKKAPGVEQNPFELENGLGDLLKPLTEQRKQGGHNPALPYERVQEFIKELIDRPCASSQAFLFCILTGCRGIEARLAEWKEFNLEKGIWIMPEAHDKKKGPRNRTRYLSSAVIDMLKQIKRVSPLLFVSRLNRGTFKPLDRSAFEKLTERMHQSRLKKGLEGWTDPDMLDDQGKPRTITPHGFRSTFRTWAETLTDNAAEHALIQIVAERILLHEKRTRCGGLIREIRMRKNAGSWQTDGRLIA